MEQNHRRLVSFVKISRFFNGKWRLFDDSSIENEDSSTENADFYAGPTSSVTKWLSLVSGWWFDGCYHSFDLHDFADDDPPNFKSFAEAARAGNPDAALAFNPGQVPWLPSLSAHQDFTAWANTRNCVVKTRNCVVKTRNCAFKMMNFAVVRSGTWSNFLPRQRGGSRTWTHSAWVKMMNCALKTRNYVFKTRNCVLKMRNSVLKTRNSVFKTRNCVLKMRNSVLKTRNSVLKMMNLQTPIHDNGGSRTWTQQYHIYWATSVTVCITIDEFCIQNDGYCIRNDGCCI